MKKLYTFFSGMLLLAATHVHASGGPDAYGYTWITSLDPGGPVLNWIDITSRPGVQTVTGLADDNSASAMAPLGFNFHYYWNDVNQVRVGSNGWLCFNSSVSNIASCFPTIPTAGGPADNYLAPLMGDLNFTGAGNPGQVKYWTNGLDSFIISYINVPFWTVNAPGWVGSNTFQVILCNSDSSITYQYTNLGGFTANAACIDLTVGIENSTGAIGLQVHSDVMPLSNYVIKFDYPTTVLLSVQDAFPVWNTSTTNAARFIFNTIAFPVVTDIRNGGNTSITSAITLTTNINDALTFANVYSGSASLPTLAAGADSVYTYPAQWTPTAVGPYSMQTSTTCSQDINPGNDVLTTELDVVNPCSPTMTLSYVSGNAPSTSINWNGGANDDGVAVYYNPPVYPYTINTLQYYISSNVGNGYIAQIVDDDGPNGSPGTILFNTTVPSASVVAGAWNTVAVTPAVTLPGGGFYVVWLQGGTNIFIGSETSSPQSHLNYEILDGSYATLRFDDSRDLCIRASIGGYAGTPTAAMTASTNQLNLTTTNSTTGPATSYLWDFGDATTSALAAPTHTYAAAGTYTVCLTATSPCGSTQACSTITVCSTPTALYSSTSNALTANFTDMSTGTATTWSWDFGDATTSALQNPSHTYATGGTYTVCLIAGNACGEADTVCQTVSVCAPNAAAFMNNGSGLNASFMDMSTGAISTWTWDFGDSGTSTLQSPSHTYASPGVYTVCLIVSNSCGFSDTTCMAVTVCNIGVAAFNYSSVEDSVMVSDASTGGIAGWFWDFGDATTSTLQNPGVHHYATGGIYTICLITTDSCGLQDTTCVQDTILITGYNINTAGVNSVYPNPASSEITVELWWNTNSAVEIYAATGQLVYSAQEINGNRFTIDVKDFATGMYTMRITNAGGTTVRRFVKE